MNKCIIIYTANYCSKIKDYFEVDNLLAEGVDIEFWDLGPITLNEKLSEVKSDGLIIKKIETFSDLRMNISINREAYYFSYINYAYYSYKIYFYLSKYNCNVVYCTGGCLPQVSSILTNGKRINFKEIITIIPRKIRSLFVLVIKKLPIFKPSFAVMMSCSQAFSDYKTSCNTHYIACSSSDYLNAKKTLEMKNVTIERYIVFVDQYIPYHNDYIVHGIKQIDPQKYYNSLNHFFCMVEEKYNCKIVIAAHPSALKYRETDFFDGRKVLFNKTSELIQNSIAVIIHHSTAVSFAVMFKKPLIIYTSDDIDAVYKNPSCYANSSLFDAILINIDHIEDVNIKSVNFKKYEEYKYAYLTNKQVEDISNSEVILSILRGDFETFKYMTNVQ